MISTDGEARNDEAQMTNDKKMLAPLRPFSIRISFDIRHSDFDIF
jgi:hypothetical protein